MDSCLILYWMLVFQWEDFFDAFQLMQSMFAIIAIVMFILFFVIFVIIIFAIDRACRKSKSVVKVPPTPAFQVVREVSVEGRLLREMLPQECPECSAPLKYDEVRWVGPHRAECPFCGHVVELQIVPVESP